MWCWASGRHARGGHLPEDMARRSVEIDIELLDELDLLEMAMELAEQYPPHVSTASPSSRCRSAVGFLIETLYSRKVYGDWTERAKDLACQQQALQAEAY